MLARTTLRLIVAGNTKNTKARNKKKRLVVRSNTTDEGARDLYATKFDDLGVEEPLPFDPKLLSKGDKYFEILEDWYTDETDLKKDEDEEITQIEVPLAGEEARLVRACFAALEKNKADLEQVAVDLAVIRQNLANSDQFGDIIMCSFSTVAERIAGLKKTFAEFNKLSKDTVAHIITPILEKEAGTSFHNITSCLLDVVRQQLGIINAQLVLPKEVSPEVFQMYKVRVARELNIPLQKLRLGVEYDSTLLGYKVVLPEEVKDYSHNSSLRKMYSKLTQAQLPTHNDLEAKKNAAFNELFDMSQKRHEEGSHAWLEHNGVLMEKLTEASMINQRYERSLQ